MDKFLTVLRGLFWSSDRWPDGELIVLRNISGRYNSVTVDFIALPVIQVDDQRYEYCVYTEEFGYHLRAYLLEFCDSPDPIHFIFEGQETVVDVRGVDNRDDMRQFSDLLDAIIDVAETHSIKF
ncbi:hypothetical protein S7335_1210 [Synechococcus sp. PCC 7335]|uniref:hypothetical protein n=1 Tax=Synechococcus sp. (strain ATCC 29403 / PCC 7335) TaxID=91464 RepID=UPI00017EB92B|nr:hypothetical protein [Synechococcus sp. PCC 7335]EDX82506.1 hypothetical protein S7335_1210 [Synechococcus sp. PCC 7335]